jgi:hypothetical protein
LNTPELTYVIKDYWKTVNTLNINVGNVAGYNDSLHQVLYIVIPDLNTILIGDYANGLTAEKIRWAKWQFGNTPKSILLFDKDNKLFFSTSTGVHYIHPGTTADTYNGASAVKIPNPTVVTALLPPEGDDNLLHYGGVRFRITGTGNLLPVLFSMDGSITNTLATIALSATPGKEPFVLANLVSQRAKLQISTNVINETFNVNRLNLYTRGIYTSYPL